MTLEQRIDALVFAGEYILNNPESWQQALEKAEKQNGWFIPAFSSLASDQIARKFLDRQLLTDFAHVYQLPNETGRSVNTGIVMAGNIPMVGFHDLLCVLLSGHKAIIKASSKDEVLIKHIVSLLWQEFPETKTCIQFADMLKGCDAYIATGSNNSARYFEYYFSRYPHIIRKNRTSVALLDGNETSEELQQLADDVYLYFGLGCRNVTKLYVPAGYDFVPLLDAFRKYDYLGDHHKYKNNYDYQLAILLLNKAYYMTNGTLLLTEAASLFSPISRLHYEYYERREQIQESLANNPDLQCVVGRYGVPFGSAQQPGLGDFADGVDTMKFLQGL